MNLKNGSRNKAIIIAIVSFALGALIYNCSRIIFQEGNPWPQIKGIVQLNFGHKDIVKLAGGENKYISRSNNPEIIKSFMKEKGYDFTEQMGSGYLFEKQTGTSAIAAHRYYSRYYSLWTITENGNDSNYNPWATSTGDDGVTYQYPESLSAKYISVAEWPPVVEIETGTFSCNTTPQELSGVSEITSQRIVDGRSYCVNIKHEGAAGSVYSSYVYTTAKDDKLIKVSFTLRYPNCANYDEEQGEACASEREAFDIDATVDRIIQSIK